MKILVMVNITKLQNSYLRIKDFINKTPILISEKLNQDFNASFYLKMKLNKLQVRSK